MTTLSDPAVRALLDAPNHGVLTTLGDDGSPHSTVVWQEPVDGAVGVNSAVGRLWPTDLQRDPRAVLVVYAPDNPYEYVEIRGRAEVADDADTQIDRLAKKFIGADTYPFRQPGEQRIAFRIVPDRVRHQKQG
ncbi:MAG TPA: PPOX class F420-dependent oxidoreductase [Acidimicrobiales bacterium]|nr:PPOX class F420-dependent oxidoreductase [Acidimicrobiales bacterium]